MSASKMEVFLKSDLDSFRRGLPSGVDADKLMKQVRKGMRLVANYIYMKKQNQSQVWKNLNNNK